MIYHYVICVLSPVKLLMMKKTVITCLLVIPVQNKEKYLYLKKKIFIWLKRCQNRASFELNQKLSRKLLKNFLKFCANTIGNLYCYIAISLKGKVGHLVFVNFDNNIIYQFINYYCHNFWISSLRGKSNSNLGVLFIKFEQEFEEFEQVENISRET